MKNKIVIIIFIVIFIIALTFLVMKKTDKLKVETQVEEVVPEEEISDEQLRNTIVTLYFKDINSGKLMPEARNIDVKEIMDEPYSKIINMLIEGPLDEDLEKCIPDGTKLLNACLENDVLIIDFSQEFLNIDSETEENQRMIINSILNTLVELREVSSIKILIEGESNVKLESTGINLYDGFKYEKTVETVTFSNYAM